jgi:hypothetical protein
MKANYWWRDRTDLPYSIRGHLDYYSARAPRARLFYWTTELSLLCVTASIPAAAGLGVSVAVTGVLGAVAAVLAGVRNITRLHEIWVAMSRSRVEIQSEVARFDACVPPYDDAGSRTAILVENTERIATQELTSWAELRLRAAASAAGSAHTQGE